MESILRTIGVYLFLLFVFRFAGKRTLSEATTFDLLLILIISETTQQAMIGDDHSLINAQLLIVTLVLLDVGLSLLKQASPRADRALDDMPLLIFRDGQPLTERMRRERISEDDILEAARSRHGLQRFDQIEFAILERDGRISIIPRQRVQPA
jgi:uncharacterized membrane protein YcaP (DUF421 family)